MNCKSNKILLRESRPENYLNGAKAIFFSGVAKITLTFTKIKK